MSNTTDEPEPPRSPVFVVGAGRSGTTLLRLMLNAHPDIAIPSESHFLGPLLRVGGTEAVLDEAAIEQAIGVVLASTEWQRDFAHSEDDLRKAVALDPITLAELIERVFRLEVGTDAAIWGDKTPHNLHFVDKLLECFPNGVAIGIVRDPRDVYISLESIGWFGRSTWEIGRYIARNGELMQRWRAAFSTDRFRVVRYEDLVLDPEPVINDLCAMLGVTPHSGMFSFYEDAPQNLLSWELETGIHTKLLRAPARDDVQRWMRELSLRRRCEIEAMTSAVIDAYDYPRRVPTRVLGAIRAETRASYHARHLPELMTTAKTKMRRRVRS